MKLTSLPLVRRARTFAVLCVLLLLQSLTAFAQSVVPVGSGSYASFTPTAEETTDSYYAMPQNQVAQFFSLLHLDPSQAGKPIPTNHWWTDLLISNRSFLPGTPEGNTQYTLQQDNYGGNQWFIPGMVDPAAYGIDIYYPNAWKAANGNGSPQGTIDKGTAISVRGDIPYGLPASDVLIADFESTTYPAGSTITGNAFPTPPSVGSGITNMISTRLANTRDGGNGVQGVLSLPNFTVNKTYLHFQMCGGNTVNTQVRLVIGGTAVLAASGVNSTSLQWISWNVSAYAGQTAHIEIVDASTASWGFIAADQIFLSDSSSPLGHFGGDMSAVKTLVTNWGDWNVDFSLADASGRKADITMVRGVPFTWTRWTNIKPKIVLGAATTFLDAGGNPITVTNGQFTATSFAMTVGGKNYGVFLPDNTVCNVGGSGATSYVSPQITGGANNYLVIGYLPAVSDLSTFGTYAYARPTDTQLTYAYQPSSNRVRTTWTITATAMKGANTQTIQGFIPHQWRTTTPNFSYQSYTYTTQRGLMKTAIGSSFQLDFPFAGIAPELPAPQQLGLTNDYSPSRMNTYLTSFNPGNMLGETYGSGKALTQCGQLMTMAYESGDLTNFNRLKTALTTALQNWLTYTPGEANGFFSEYTDWKAIIGWDASYGSQAFNDLHFHYGYFATASALLGRFDKTYLTNYGPMIKKVVKSFANYDRTDTSSPFFRTFDIWEGHSNAGGMSSANGENQESSSEAMNSWVGLYLLGSVMNDSQMTAAGAMGYAMESRAVNEYWQDLNNDVHPAVFNRAGAAMVWGDNFTYATYFDGDPAWVYAIQYVPAIHWLNYLVPTGKEAVVAQKYADMWTERQAYFNGFPTWNSTTAYAQYDYVGYQSKLYYVNALAGVPAGAAAPDANSAWSNAGSYTAQNPGGAGSYLGNYILGFEALWDAENSAADFEGYFSSGNPIAATNNSLAGTNYYTIHATRQLGAQDFTYSASVPTAAVYYNATTNTRTAVIYNPGATTVNVSLYKNAAAVQTVSVPADSTVTAFVGNTPAITSYWKAEGMLTAAMTYQITATNSPTSYSIVGTLPPGLSFSTSTGAITGTPTTIGTSTITIKATNANGTGSKQLTIQIYPFTNPPAITSANTAPGQLNTAFSYQIAATNSPTSYSVVGALPAGVALNTSTGLISGTPTSAGTFPVTVKATNVGGTGQLAVTISVLQNFALTGTALGSTETVGQEASKAIDGLPATRWTAASGAYPQWWRVDLGAAKPLSRVDIMWYSPTTRAYKYKLETSNDDSIYNTVFDNTNNTTNGNSSDVISATARYLRVTVTGSSTGGNAAAYEIAVLG
ncbi:MAG: glycosyl hydrolase, partial [Chthoniobacterales bacterium]